MLNEQKRPYNPYFLFPFLLWIVIGGLLLDSLSKEELFFAVNTHNSHFADVAMFYTTWLGEGSFIIVLLVALFVFPRLRNRQYFIAAVLCNVTPLLIQKGIKAVVSAPRPQLYFKGDPALHCLPEWPKLVLGSFPSGHSEGAFALFCFLSLLLPARYRAFGLLFFILALAVCYSRIYLAAHFFEDVYVGSIIGGLSTTIIYAIMFLYQDRSFKKQDA